MYFQALFRGKISGQRQKGLKVNPLYSDIQTGVKHRQPVSDVNDNMNSVHFVTYETFPVTKHQKSNEKSSPVIVENGNPAQNGTLHNRGSESKTRYQNGSLQKLVKQDEIMDENRNRLKQTKSDPTEKRHMNGNVSGFVRQNKNVPVLLGPANGNLYIVDENVTCSQSETKTGMQPEKLASGQRDLGPLKREEQSDLDIGSYQSGTKMNGDENIDNQSMRATDADEVKVVIENINSENCEAVTSCIPESSGHKETDQGKEEFLGYDNDAFESEGQVAIEDFEETDSTNGSSRYLKRNPLVHQECIDESFEHNVETDMVHKTGTVHAGKGKRHTGREILTEALVHVNENGEQGLGSSKLKRNKAVNSDEDSVCHSEEKIKDDWPDLDSLVRQDTDEGEQTNENIENNSYHSNRSVHFLDETHRHARSVSDVILPGFTESGDPNSSQKTQEKDKTSLYSKNAKKHPPKTVTYSTNGSTRTLKSILTNGCSVSQCSNPESCSHKHSDSESEIHELKSVKFSEDTVFNENKSNKYKQEKVGRINLREIYHGKIVSDSAMAKMNPLYIEDETKPDGEGQNGSMTDDEKMAYQIALKKAMKMSKRKVLAFAFLFYCHDIVMHRSFCILFIA